MKTTLFTYETAAGTFWIRPEPAGRVRLGIGETRLKSYHSATAAARGVATRHTGYPAWDDALNTRAPRTLQDWKRDPSGVASRKSRAARLNPED